MKLRTIEPSDIDAIKGIHEKHYSSEFSFEEFKRNYYGAFLVENNLGVIVSAGGLRPIAEAVIVTNKDFEPEDRKLALYMMLDASIATARNLNFGAIHAFISDPQWSNRLKRTGFEPTKGESLIFKFRG